MSHPPPHSFSRSPVEEVFCRCSLGSNAEPLSLTVPPPYPGWPHIRGRIRDMVAGAREVSRITGCMLRYTDLLPVADEKNLPGNEEIEKLLSGKFDAYFDHKQNEIMLITTGIPDTAGSVRSIHTRPGKTGWSLIFTMKTEGPVSFVSGDSVLNWFDDARAEIHGLFDLIVPEEIVQGLG
jgi:uncharacterized protein (TIGR04255 family)